VVAEEVRNLAQRSAEAAKQTAALLEQSQKKRGQRRPGDDAGRESLRKTIASSARVAQLVGEIAAATRNRPRYRASQHGGVQMDG